MNSYDFTGRTALVTGGASGIGAAAADRLRAGGAEVAVFDREPVEAYVSVTGDIASSADVNAAVGEVEGELGRIDVLVNAAGVPGESLRTVDVSDEEWRNANARHPDVLAAQRRERARVRSERQRRWGHTARAAA